MPRPRRCRRISFLPNVNYFKPSGIQLVDLEENQIKMEELEAIRLKDLLGMPQEECSERMNISQPTFHRLIISARRKITDSIVNGKAIKIEGGNYEVHPGLRRRKFQQ